MLHKVLDTMKEIIGNEKSGNSKILIDTHDKMLNNISLKIDINDNVVKDYNDVFPQLLLLEEALFLK